MTRNIAEAAIAWRHRARIDVLKPVAEHGSPASRRSGDRIRVQCKWAVLVNETVRVH
jgi:hypothetical protein